MRLEKVFASSIRYRQTTMKKKANHCVQVSPGCVWLFIVAWYRAFLR
jgi:hypothetical protein